MPTHANAAPESVYIGTERIEVRTLDARFLVRGPRPVDPRIAIIGIDQKTLNDVGFPFSRYLYAKMLDRVCGEGARAIVKRVGPLSVFPD